MIDTVTSTVSFNYHVELEAGKVRSFTDQLFFKDVTPELWTKVPPSILASTLQSLLLMIGINYWTVYPTSNMQIEGFTLTQAQADFWNTLYLNVLGEFFYLMKMDFSNLISFPFDDKTVVPRPVSFKRPARSLLLNGAGKDSILSAEMLKTAGTPFDFFAFTPSLAHEKIGELVGAKTIRVTRRRDPRINITMNFHIISSAYPSVSTFTFIATLLAELIGYDSIVFSNERSADIGNLTYRGLSVNHQWCKSSEAEKLVNDYIKRFITTDITTTSLLRKYSELEIVKEFIKYPQYLPYVTSCNSYFCYTRFEQRFLRTPYWCGQCPKCMFLFACYAAYVPKQELVKIFGANLFNKRGRLPYIKRILGLEGFKPLDCVGEPEEMIVAMHYASIGNEYAGDRAMQLFEENFPKDYDFTALEQKVFTNYESVKS